MAGTGSERKPHASIGRAIRDLRPGNAVRVHVVANALGSAVTPTAFVGAVDGLVANTTFRSNDYRWLFRILQETTGSTAYPFLETGDCRVIGNIFHFHRATLSRAVNVGAPPAIGALAIEGGRR